MNLIEALFEFLRGLFFVDEPTHGTGQRPPRARGRIPSSGTGGDDRPASARRGIYKKAGNIVTRTEAKFCNVLLRCVPSHVGICPKVRIGDIVQVVDGLSWVARRTAQNHIFQKHVDFVLCDMTSYSVLAVVELDDPSHERADRQRRDELVDSVLFDAGLPFLHVTTKPVYDEPDLTAAIARLVGGGVSTGQPRT